jgi:hypothetical protein
MSTSQSPTPCSAGVDLGSVGDQEGGDPRSAALASGTSGLDRSGRCVFLLCYEGRVAFTYRPASLVWGADLHVGTVWRRLRGLVSWCRSGRACRWATIGRGHLMSTARVVTVTTCGGVRCEDRIRGETRNGGSGCVAGRDGIWHLACDQSPESGQAVLLQHICICWGHLRTGVRLVRDGGWNGRVP